jgi:hypothetical protein
MYRYMIRPVLFHRCRRAARQQPRSIQNLANNRGSDNCSLDLGPHTTVATAAVTTVTTT